MKEKQRKLGTESHLRARNEGGGKVEASIFSILLTAVVGYKIYKCLDQTIYSFTAIASPICK